MSLAVPEKQQVRLVFLGAAGVGKTSLIRRFLLDAFDPEHRRTVEELHCLEYEERGGPKVRLEILDTSGSYSFPAMRKLSIRRGDAFALVYSVEDAESLESVRSLRAEIAALREDRLPPVVVVGNKADREAERKVSAQQALATVEGEWGGRHVEASAKENRQVLEVFRQLLQQIDVPGRWSPALRRRRETIPKEKGPSKPPLNKTNSCSIC
uniref:Ras-related protein Rap-2a-like n=1 Tax=Geotrypetes seraphini TaxID=260995 RepID=A0A6P8SCI3_GEOSA|nr:ras-related protein Rap-2a-like [Geotrypetes seraphini]